MEKTITFHIDEKDKELVETKAKEKRLSVSAYCRVKILDNLSSFEQDLWREDREALQFRNNQGVNC